MKEERRACSLKPRSLKLCTILLVLTFLLYSSNYAAADNKYSFAKIKDTIKANFSYQSALFHWAGIFKWADKKGRLSKQRTFEYDVKIDEHGSTVSITQPTNLRGIHLLYFYDTPSIIYQQIGSSNSPEEKISDYARFKHFLNTNITLYDLFILYGLNEFSPTEFVRMKLRGTDCVRIRLEPKNKKAIPYKFVYLYVTKKDWLPYQFYYFNQVGEPIKKLDFLEYSFYKNHWLPKTIRVVNLKTGSQLYLYRVKTVIRKP